MGTLFSSKKARRASASISATLASKAPENGIICAPVSLASIHSFNLGNLQTQTIPSFFLFGYLLSRENPTNRSAVQDYVEIWQRTIKDRIPLANIEANQPQRSLQSKHFKDRRKAVERIKKTRTTCSSYAESPSRTCSPGRSPAWT